LAARVAEGEFLVKVDCDVMLDEAFLEEQMQFMTNATLMTLDWASIRTESERNLRGTFFAPRRAFLDVYGYDERIANYGAEEDDLYRRMSSELGMAQRPLDIAKLHHVSIEESSSPVTLPQVWIQVNNIALGKLPPWRDVAPHICGRFALATAPDAPFIRAKATRTSPDALELLSDNDRFDSLLLASQRVLHDRHKMPWDVISELAVKDAGEILHQVEIYRRRLLFVELNGVLPERLLGLLWAVCFASTYDRVLVINWGATWGDPSAPPHPQRAAREKSPQTAGIEHLLDLARTNARLKDSGLAKIFLLREWRCRVAAADCVQWDRAYDSLDEYAFDGVSADAAAAAAEPGSVSVPNNPRKNVLVRTDGAALRGTAGFGGFDQKMRTAAMAALALNGDVEARMEEVASLAGGGRRGDAGQEAGAAGAMGVGSVGVYASVRSEDVGDLVWELRNRFNGSLAGVFITGPNINAVEAVQKEVHNNHSPFSLSPITSRYTHRNPSPSTHPQLSTDPGASPRPGIAASSHPCVYASVTRCLQSELEELLALLRCTFVWPRSGAERAATTAFGHAAGVLALGELRRLVFLTQGRL